eukprot:5450175-Prymnesium_polylepis.1
MRSATIEQPSAALRGAHTTKPRPQTACSRPPLAESAAVQPKARTAALRPMCASRTTRKRRARLSAPGQHTGWRSSGVLNDSQTSGVDGGADGLAGADCIGFCCRDSLLPVRRRSPLGVLLPAQCCQG